MEQRVARGLGLGLAVGIVVALSSVACSGTTTRVSAGPSATTPSSDPAVPTTAPAVSSTSAGPTTAVPDVTPSSTATSSATVPTTAPTTIPAQPADPQAAEAAIREAFATLIDVNATPTQLQGAVQGMQNPGGLTTWQQAKNLMTGAGVAVYSVRFTNAITATVVFQFFYNGGLSPIFPKPLDGGVVYEAGHWRIDTPTACSLAVSAGYPCPGYSAQPPTTDTVPAGVTVPTNPPTTYTVPRTSVP